MRVTTQMLNDASRKAGLPVNGTSLLNYINKNSSSTTNSLLSALSKKTKTDTTQKSTYEQLEKSANELEDSVSVLASEKEENLFEQAQEDGNTEALKKQTKEFISDYNDMLKKLLASGSTVNTYYAQMLGEVCDDNQESLKGIGISADKNGYLSLDESEFDEADLATLEKVLGQASSFMQKISFVAGRVENNAQSYLESMSSTYNAEGNSIYSYISNKYSSWG